jgi:pSer/pThr/pTyr-binding forkhead associated (FHA) protein
MSAVMEAINLIAKPPVSPGKVDETARRRRLVVNQTILIGRAAECQLRLSSLNVSRRHCLLRVSPAEAWVTDLQSSNGTYVDGQRLVPGEETRVGNGSKVIVGPYEFTVRSQSLSDNAGVDGADEKELGSSASITVSDVTTDTTESSGSVVDQSSQAEHGLGDNRRDPGTPTKKRRNLRTLAGTAARKRQISEEVDITWLSADSDGVASAVTHSVPLPLADSQVTIVSPVMPAGTIPEEIIVSWPGKRPAWKRVVHQRHWLAALVVFIAVAGLLIWLCTDHAIGTARETLKLVFAI